MHVETFGQTEEGRELPLLVISDPQGRDAAEAAQPLGRPVVFVQANIHAGEVEGKEAALMLARRLTDGNLKPLTRQLVILIAPIYNADGNEKVSAGNRTAQNGPVAGVGTRENAKGLDLNRDYMKLDSAEARALVGLMTTWDPHVVVDLHTTNGSYHGYHLTYAPTLNPNADAAAHRVRTRHAAARACARRCSTRTTSAPTTTATSRRRGAMLARARAWIRRTPATRPGGRSIIARALATTTSACAIASPSSSEAYSYLDFKGRVDVTAAFVEEVLRASARHASRS